MAGKKYDGIIEAVRYAPGGKIDVARIYERRGAVWSDRLVLERADLVARLKKKQRFVTGTRRTYLGSQFETGPVVRCVNEYIVTDGQSASRDELTGVGEF